MLKLIFLAWITIAFLIARWGNARIRKHEEAIGAERVGLYAALVPLGYAYSIGFWPIAIPLGAWWVARRPDLARQGRITLWWGLGLASVQLFIAAFWRELWSLAQWLG